MIETTQKRENDEKQERVTTQFFVDWFNKIKGKDDTIEVITDKERQVKGLDFILTLKGKEYTIDLKAATDYVNKPKPLWTFTQELTTLNRANKLIIGWLFNEELVNDYIAYLWIDKAKTDNLTCVDDIENAEIAIVRKDMVIKYLLDRGMPKELLLAIADDLRFNNGVNVKELTNGKYDVSEQYGKLYVGDCYKDGFKIVFSKIGRNGKPLKEQPVNVQVSRKALINLSEFHYKITPDFIY
jgi:hypothetical protein